MAKKGAAVTQNRSYIYIPKENDPDPYSPGFTVQWKPIYCNGFDLKEDGTREYHHFQNRLKCGCKPGPHHIALSYGPTVEELALIGGRGSGKSEHGFAILISGDLESGGKPLIDNKFYRALVLRRNAKDLHNWFARARDFFGAFGARPTESPTMKFVFPSGAEIICDHLEDESAYQKYLGHEYALILIEECPQIPKESMYLNLRRSNRVRYGLGMKARMVVLGNPDGPGLGWFIKRFVNLRHPDGRALKSGEVWKNPTTGEKRMFVHSTVYDNPYFLRGNAEYVKQLEGIDDDTERRRWLMGDFTAMVGQFFATFRPNGPLSGEPDNARHVFPADSVRIEPWWPRIMAMDVGFRHHAAVYKAALAPDGRLIVYDEMVEAEVDNEEWGMRVAAWCQKELQHLPSRSIPLFLSHDAFGNRGEGRTQAEQIAHGIQRVLGNPGVMLAGGPVESDDKAEGGMSEEQYFKLISERQGPRIIIRQPLSRKRVDGWQWIRVLLKWTGAKALDAGKINPDHLRRLAESGDQEAVNDYLQSFRPNHGQVLPRLVILDRCRLLIEAIPTLVYDTDGKNPEDVRKTETIEDDIADAFRYLCVSYRKIVERLPRSVFMERKIAAARDAGANENDLFTMQDFFDEQYDEQSADMRPFTYGIGSPRLHGLRYPN